MHCRNSETFLSDEELSRCQTFKWNQIKKITKIQNHFRLDVRNYQNKKKLLSFLFPKRRTFGTFQKNDSLTHRRFHLSNPALLSTLHDTQDQAESRIADSLQRSVGSNKKYDYFGQADVYCKTTQIWLWKFEDNFIGAGYDHQETERLRKT